MFLFILYVYLVVTAVGFGIAAFNIRGDQLATVFTTVLSVTGVSILVYLIKVSFFG